MNQTGAVNIVACRGEGQRSHRNQVLYLYLYPHNHNQYLVTHHTAAKGTKKDRMNPRLRTYKHSSKEGYAVAVVVLVLRCSLLQRIGRRGRRACPNLVVGVFATAAAAAAVARTFLLLQRFASFDFPSDGVVNSSTVLLVLVLEGVIVAVVEASLSQLFVVVLFIL